MIRTDIGVILELLEAQSLSVYSFGSIEFCFSQDIYIALNMCHFWLQNEWIDTVGGSATRGYKPFCCSVLLLCLLLVHVRLGQATFETNKDPTYL